MRGIAKLSEARRVAERIRQRRAAKDDQWRRLQLTESAKRSQKKYPERAKARLAVRNAIRHGDLVRPEHCQNCNATCKPDAHHEDYAKPLEVIWLCDACHGRTRLTATTRKNFRLTFSPSTPIPEALEAVA
jgi:cell division protein FtsL